MINLVYGKTLLIILAVELLYFTFGFVPRMFAEHMSIIPLNLLRDNFLSSIFFFHSQPPLFNGIIGLILKIKDIIAISVTDQVFLGYSFVAINHVILFLAIYSFLRLMLKQNYKEYLIYLSVIVIFLNPTIISFLYLSFYTIWIYLLSIIAVCSLTYGFINNKPKDLILSIFVFSITFYIYSLYSILILLCFACGITILYKKFSKKDYAIIALILLFPIVLTIKNYKFFGIISQSSWLGNSLYKMVYSNMSDNERRELVKNNEISAIALNHPFDGMELNKEYEKEYKVKYCIDNKLLCDSYPILSSDGWGNAGELIMSKILEKDATYIIKNYPEIYFKSLVDSFRIFFMTSVEYTEFIYSNMKLPKVIKTLHPLTKYGKREYWFSLTIVMTYIILLTYAVISLFNSRYRMQITAFLTFFSLCFFLVTEKRSFVIFYMLYLLLLIIAYLIGVVTTIFKNRRFDFKYENKVTIICLGIIFYLLVTSNLIEVGENMRFRMGSDVMLLPILLFFLKDVKHYITAMDFNKLFMKIKKCLSG